MKGARHRQQVVRRKDMVALLPPIQEHGADGRDASLVGDAVHQWYQIIMGFDWKLVQHIIERLEIGPEHLVLDPFCGAGTTLVQCKKQGIRSVGIDANPVCTLASQVKTSWHLHPDRLRDLLADIVEQAEAIDSSGI